MRVEWTTGAQRNLDSIERYIARDNPTAAAKTVLKIVKRTFSQLSTQPSSGKPGRIDGTRELIFTEFPYIVIYTVRQDAVFILRVFHTSQCLENLPEQ
ncbi:type II toxin-antitoxin system RelE/ParE family toxin [Pelobacter propionicus]|uniref:Addiction module toxin, RelE/StbE family n=1 Tax=Pelobacter propionicus (strain DSM 2379 / NBRC 103807 / OttBd1) TaxID=338966 RepID=A1AN19_PELPD|nr:type II toxin-antitoxin system mRNA interferase toxin, RelE/StbE family [Pelobacter propionicus]ABK98739.1 addiction module toxin, RelE/StbE family [Pelobacter propionicus DSM 2379]